MEDVSTRVLEKIKNIDVCNAFDSNLGGGNNIYLY